MLQPVSSPLVAVIPTFVFVGPAALLAALFPAVFGGLALVLRRWLILLTVASVISTLWLAHAWFRGYAEEGWWGTPQAFWIAVAVAACLGALLSWRRVSAAARLGKPAALAPGRWARIWLALASAAGVAAVLYAQWHGVLLRWPWRDALPLWATVWAGALFLLGVRLYARNRPATASGMATEAIMLGALSVSCVLMGWASPRPVPQVVWTFEAADRGIILSSPLVANDRLYVGAAHGNARGPFGAVYCLDLATGKPLWTFSRDGLMKQVYSSPVLDSGRLYVGEGLHEDADCRMYCLDAATGRELWSFPTHSHTESSPRVAGGCVFFGAGDDGVYGLDAASGDLRWRFPGRHVDTTPAVVGNRLYAGCAYGTFEVFCLDTGTGRPLWQVPTTLGVYGSPAVYGDRVFVGLGNGKLNRSADQPAGALLCLDAGTGREIWRCAVGDAVFCTPVVHGDLVIFGARDRSCYAADVVSGKVRWQTNVGSPIAAAPVLVGAQVVIVGSAGRVYCLDATSGQQVWSLDIARQAQTSAELVSTPAKVNDSADQRLYLGAGLRYPFGYAAKVYCLKPPGK
jgi:outer membrane protein assembly factor BamB